MAIDIRVQERDWKPPFAAGNASCQYRIVFKIEFLFKRIKILKNTRKWRNEAQVLQLSRSFFYSFLTFLLTKMISHDYFDNEKAS